VCVCPMHWSVYFPVHLYSYSLPFDLTTITLYINSSVHFMYKFKCLFSISRRQPISTCISRVKIKEIINYCECSRESPTAFPPVSIFESECYFTLVDMLILFNFYLSLYSWPECREWKNIFFIRDFNFDISWGIGLILTIIQSGFISVVMIFF
jgi:hypothetical protein